jgi:TRAP-type uncharacterized transport system fused permease subunit
MTVTYAARATRHEELRDRELRRSRLVARWRLATFVPAILLLIWALTRGSPPFAGPLATLLFVVFAVLVVRHARIEERAAWHDALLTVNRRA